MSNTLKELKILGFVAVVVGVVYWGVEPLAHMVFYPKTAPEDFAFSDLEDLPTSGDASRGKDLVTSSCVACHSIEKDGFPAILTNDLAAEAYGVVPPDLSNIGAIYDHKFLANLIKDPVKALKLTHKFDDSKPFPMTATMVSDEELGDMVQYFKELAKDAELDNKAVFTESCARCHSVKYDNVEALTSPNIIAQYLGTQAPDLSTMIKSRGEEKLSKFINDPQKILVNASMPRVGLTKESQEKVISYLTSVGDSKKDERERIGKILIGFMALMTILAYLWKRKIWKDLH